MKRPWVVQDALGQDVIAIRPLMNITLTYDHRLVDGAYSGGFLRDPRARLEGWSDAGAHLGGRVAAMRKLPLRRRPLQVTGPFDGVVHCHCASCQ